MSKFIFTLKKPFFKQKLLISPHFHKKNLALSVKIRSAVSISICSNQGLRGSSCVSYNQSKKVGFWPSRLRWLMHLLTFSQLKLTWMCFTVSSHFFYTRLRDATFNGHEHSIFVFRSWIIFETRPLIEKWTAFFSRNNHKWREKKGLKNRISVPKNGPLSWNSTGLCSFFQQRVFSIHLSLNRNGFSRNSLFTDILASF